ncbi:hypothetical protein ACLMJK_006835 [Lecanora helva]
MKLIIAGASGSVATELIRQSLNIPAVTSIIALSRKPITSPPKLDYNVNASKFQNVVLQNYDTYPEDVRAKLAGADACIWTVAITPSKSRGIPPDEVRRVCYDYTIAGLQAIFKAQGEGSRSNSSPFRFLYMSGAASERDQSKTPPMMAEYCLMRGEVENEVLAFAHEHKGALEACVAKPGIIVQPGEALKNAAMTAAKYTVGVPSLRVAECAAAMLHEVIHGFTKEPLVNEDLVRIGQQALK